jgi:hypothetical protein
MATFPKSVKGVKPVSWRWVRRIGDGDRETGLLEINGALYGVYLTSGGFRVVKGDGTAYDVNGERFACNCPDATYRGRQCKHSQALRAAFSAAGQP